MKKYFAIFLLFMLHSSIYAIQCTNCCALCGGGGTGGGGAADTCTVSRNCTTGPAVSCSGSECSSSAILDGVMCDGIHTMCAIQ